MIEKKWSRFLTPSLAVAVLAAVLVGCAEQEYLTAEATIESEERILSIPIYLSDSDQYQVTIEGQRVFFSIPEQYSKDIDPGDVVQVKYYKIGDQIFVVGYPKEIHP